MISTIFLFISAFLYSQTNITVLNASFEKPNSGKIKGWDGVCSNPAWTNLIDVPGWDDDAPAWDSGVEDANATDGSWTGFLMAQDSSIYQVLGKRVYIGDIIQLSVDSKDNWQATTLRMQLFYLEDGNDTTKFPIVS